MLAHFPVVRRLVHASELDETGPSHRRALRKADRVIDRVTKGYVELDGYLKLDVRHK